jgi:hypothetical protein
VMGLGGEGDPFGILEEDDRREERGFALDRITRSTVFITLRVMGLAARDIHSEYWRKMIGGKKEGLLWIASLGE